VYVWRFATRAVTGLLDSVAPYSCAGCDQIGAPICWQCRARIDALPVPRSPDNADLTIHAAFPYAAPVDRIIQRAKYHDARSALTDLASLAAVRLPMTMQTMLAPIPVGRRRRRHRGHNQAAVIARRLAETSGAGLCDQLGRRRDTDPQVGRNLTQRQRNVAAAFEWRGPTVPPQRVTLVDDVHTTGATLRSAASALRGAGAGHVDAVVLAAVR
jgi:ComF family protein